MDAAHSRCRWLALIVPVCVFAVLGVPATAGAASLGPNLLVNGDFERPAITPAFIRIPNGTTGLSGWTASGGGVEIMRSEWQAPHGSQSVDLSNFGASEIEQEVATTPGGTYRLSWSIAGNPSCTFTTIRALTAFWNGKPVETATFTQGSNTAASMGWRVDAIGVTATGTTSTVAFARDVGAGGCGVAIDNTSLQLEGGTTTPPPATGGSGGSRAHSGTSAGANGVTARSTIASSLATPAQAFSSWRTTLFSAAIAVVAILLITFPAQLFNRTFDENYDQIVAFWERRFPFIKPMRAAMLGGHDRARSRGVVVLVVVVGALLGGLLDPDFGINGRSLSTYIAVVLSTLWGIAVSTGALIVYRRLRHRDTAWSLRALPAGLLIAAGCVLISRVTDFEPGYLYGVVCGAVFTGALAKHEQGHAVVLATLLTVVLAFLAWFAWVPVNSAAGHPGASMPLVVFDDFLGAVFTGGLIGATIGMVPLRFLPGGTLAAWHRWAWAAVTFVVTFAFIEIMLNPARGGHRGSAGLGTVLVLFVLFGGGSALFAYHYRRKPGISAGAAAES